MNTTVLPADQAGHAPVGAYIAKAWAFAGLQVAAAVTAAVGLLAAAGGFLGCMGGADTPIASASLLTFGGGAALAIGGLVAVQWTKRRIAEHKRAGMTLGLTGGAR